MRARFSTQPGLGPATVLSDIRKGVLLERTRQRPRPAAVLAIDLDTRQACGTATGLEKQAPVRVGARAPDPALKREVLDVATRAYCNDAYRDHATRPALVTARAGIAIRLPAEECCFFHPEAAWAVVPQGEPHMRNLHLGRPFSLAEVRRLH